MENTTNAIIGIFAKYNPYPDLFNIKMICDIEDDFTVTELFDLYKENELHKAFFIKLWAVSDDTLESRFLLYIAYEDDTFRIAYNYPHDKKEDRNYFAELSIDDLFELPVKDVSIFRIEFYNIYLVDWSFIPANMRYPRLDFVIADINASKRFGKNGIYNNDSMSRFEIVDSQNKRIVYIIEYNKNGDTFSLIVRDNKFNFDCLFEERWHYFYQGIKYDNIDLLFGALS